MLHTHKSQPKADEARRAAALLRPEAPPNRRDCLTAIPARRVRGDDPGRHRPREADVFKVTVYAHAKNKRDLFTGIVNSRVALVYRSMELMDAAAAE